MLRREHRAPFPDRWALFRRGAGVGMGSLIRVSYRAHHAAPAPASFTGMLIAVRRHCSDPTILVRAAIDGVGVEQLFCLRSPLIEGVEVVREATNWRRKCNKLYWLRKHPERIPSFFKRQASPQ